MSAIDDIKDERRRQIEVEGWSAQHDDRHDQSEIAMAAACYALSGNDVLVIGGISKAPLLWPWCKKWWKPASRRKDLIKAAALLIAEIERLDRLSEEQKQ